MKITRRHLLALSAATVAAGVVCAGGVGLSWWDQPAGAGYQHLSTAEAEFVRAFGGAAFPGGATVALDGSDAGLDHFYDALLDGMPEVTASLLRLLTHALDGAARLGGGGGFTALSRQAQQAHLEAWLQSDIAEVRGAISSLVVLLGMGYTIHPDVAPLMSQWHRCGYGA